MMSARMNSNEMTMVPMLNARAWPIDSAFSHDAAASSAAAVVPARSPLANASLAATRSASGVSPHSPRVMSGVIAAGRWETAAT
jgi:hypothetical protein